MTFNQIRGQHSKIVTHELKYFGFLTANPGVQTIFMVKLRDINDKYRYFGHSKL